MYEIKVSWAIVRVTQFVFSERNTSVQNVVQEGIRLRKKYISCFANVRLELSTVLASMYLHGHVSVYTYYTVS